MVKASASTVIARPPQDVYAFISDLPRNYRRWSPEVVQLQFHTQGPIRVGSTARQVRVDQGRRTETTFRVSAMEPGRQVSFVGTSNPFRVEYLMDPVPTGTRLTFVFELGRLEFFMRPFEKLIRMAVQEGSERVVRNIRTLVERELPADTDSSA